MKKKNIQKVINEVWPKARKELEKIAKETKVLINKGEKEMVKITDKSVRGIKSVELQLKKEKLYYDLGKLIAQKSPKSWSETKKATDIVKEIKGIGRKIDTLKKK